MAEKIVLGISLAMLLFLFVVSILYSSDGYEISANGIEIFPLAIVGAVALLIMAMVTRNIDSLPKWMRALGALAVLAGVLIFCAWWIANSANLPQSDEKSIYDIAIRARNHDLLPIAPTGSYMSLWPFQAGLVLFEEAIMRIIPDTNEMTIQWVYMPFMALSLISAYMVVRKMFCSGRTAMIWCLLMAFCLPYYFYINNMYGEIPSISLMFFSLWMLLEYLPETYGKHFGWIFLMLMGMGIAGAVAIRKNTLIFVIACCIVLLTLALSEKKGKYLLAIIVLVVATFLGTWFPRELYEKRANNTMGSGVPAISYLAMGLQWDEGRDAGAWNGYHADLFMECGFDAEKTAEISWIDYKNLLCHMAENPGYALSFFYNKLVSQWTREDYSCLYSTLEFYGERSQAAWKIYRGGGTVYCVKVMSVHQSIVFLGAVLFCLTTLRRRQERYELIRFILLVTFVGGFLFSMIWEAGSRYVMPYFVMLIPYAAAGYKKIIDCIERGWIIMCKEKRGKGGLR